MQWKNNSWLMSGSYVKNLVYLQLNLQPNILWIVSAQSLVWCHVLKYLLQLNISYLVSVVICVKVNKDSGLINILLKNSRIVKMINAKFDSVESRAKQTAHPSTESKSI